MNLNSNLNAVSDLKTVSDEALLRQTRSAVAQERQAMALVLRNLHEIDRRRLHLSRGFSSLHEYCVSELKYSDGAAHRRIAAMRLITQTPQASALVEEGKLSLTTAAQLQDFFKAEHREKKNYSTEQRLALVRQAEGKSRREVERILVSISPENRSLSSNTERQRVISESHTALTLVLNSAQLAKLERFRQCTSHRNAAAKIVELIEQALDLALEKVDPEKKQRAASPKKPGKSLGCTQMPTHVENPMDLGKPMDIRKPAVAAKHSTVLNNSSSSNSSNKTRKPSSTPGRYIAASTRRQLYAQAHGQCMYRDPLTDKRCEARSLLEIDHIWPYALGGNSELTNLRLVCRPHNQLLAIHVFGEKKIAPYLAQPPG